MQTEHIHSLNLLYITLKLIVVLLEHQVDMISIFQRLTELGLSDNLPLLTPRPPPSDKYHYFFLPFPKLNKIICKLITIPMPHTDYVIIDNAELRTSTNGWT